MINRVCLACGKNFRAFPCKVRKGYAKYCSRPCRVEALRGVRCGPTRTLEERFWEKVNKRTPPECWPWVGGTDGYANYGRISDRVGKVRPAHQISWELLHDQPFPSGRLACHTCDNPNCVNPAHIYPGTAQDNVDDMKRRGRTTLGRLRSHCKHGHALAGENVYVFRGNRACMECKRRRSRESIRRRRSVEPTVKREGDVVL